VGACARRQPHSRQGVDRRRQCRIGDAAIGGETDGGKESGARGGKIGMGRDQIFFCRDDVGSPRE